MIVRCGLKSGRCREIIGAIEREGTRLRFTFKSKPVIPPAGTRRRLRPGRDPESSVFKDRVRIIEPHEIPELLPYECPNHGTIWLSGLTVSRAMRYGDDDVMATKSRPAMLTKGELDAALGLAQVNLRFAMTEREETARACGITIEELDAIRSPHLKAPD